MSFEADEEILQDFLVEAGEILESLSEELVELENDVDNAELLNSIFRGFHTVKGGAGFLSLGDLVDVCHGAENIFDLLRTGKRSVNAELMDTILSALDTVNDMFVMVQNKEPLVPAEANLLAELARLSHPDVSTPAVTEVIEQSTSTNEESSSSDEMSEDEFEKLLDELHGSGSISSTPNLNEAVPNSTPTPSTDGSSDEISDDEFESLLDELHGQGAFSVDTAATKGSALSTSSDDIDDLEFEKLLDELHGKGNAPKAVESSVTNNPVSIPTPPPEKQVQAKAVSPKVTPQKATQKKAQEEPAKIVAKKAASTPAPQGETTVRVDTKRLDDIMNMVGELVLVRNRLVRLGLKSADESMAKAVANLDVVTGDLQTAVMKTRMQPIKKVFGRFPRVVRDLARNLKKEINLELEGEETDLDKNLVEALADPLVHLVRNSVDHGIEQPNDREAAGKPRAGRVVLSAEQEGDHIVLSIYDDGGGMDPNMLRGKAVEKGVMDQEAADRLSDQEAFNLIFHPGFSTKTEISDVSGRGVGMDVVKTKINQLNGTIDVNSEAGVGTNIAIKVPLTLAIMPTLMVMLGNQAFALPLVSVNEIFHLDLSKTNVVDGQEVVVVREKALPLFHLRRWLINGEYESKTQAHVVIVSVGTQKVGFVVDQLIGQEEVVIKPLSKMLHGTPGMAGATITGDGRIALILDVPSMLNSYAHR